ncbi:MAG TPA: MgtC/SapB family protein [Chitinophagaceae bacterium]
MMDHWEILDIYKALLAVAAGLILGLERELKDKAAGLKTITIITLGATLFSIISYKVGGADRGTAIAAYIVSGVGFLGAGVIFKDGITVSGLTTAGIIWLAAAIGTSIGFGEFYMAATFMGAALLTIFVLTPIVNAAFNPKKSRILEVEIEKNQRDEKDVIIGILKNRGIKVEERKLELKSGLLIVTLELVMKEKQLEWLQEYLVENKTIISFSI